MNAHAIVIHICIHVAAKRNGVRAYSFALTNLPNELMQLIRMLLRAQNELSDIHLIFPSMHYKHAI